MAVSSSSFRTRRWNVRAMVTMLSLLFLLNPCKGEEQQLTCATGWSSSGGEQVILPEQINDGYCDCPMDGADEPDTQACSGSATWPGIQTPSSESSATSSLLFSCPQQPNLKLPPSRMNDGICDCCDGADEIGNTNNDNNKCDDICDEVLRAEREAKAAAIKNYSVGSTRRISELATFQQLRAEKLVQVQDMEVSLAALGDTGRIANELEAMKMTYLTERLATVKEISNNGSAADIVGALTAEELEAFMIHVCQVDGEISEADDDDHTCVSLRLAGLDLGMMWADDNYHSPNRMSLRRMDDEKNPSLGDLVNIMFENASSSSTSKKWKLHQIRDGGRRRLDEYDGMYDHDDYHGDDYGGDHEMYDDFDDEIYDDDDYMHRHESRGNRNVQDVSWDIAPGKMGNVMQAVKDTPFTKIRMVFMDRAKEVIDQIGKALDGQKKNSEAEEKTDGADAEAEPATEDTKPADFDPTAYAMVRSSLRRKGNAIMKGLKWGASAKILFEGNHEFTEDELKRLAIGTVYHGSLTSLHVWQILQSIVPELRGADAPEESCASPWAAACPPKTVEREGTVFPPALLLEAAEKFCAQEAEQAMQGKECEDSSVIPASIPPTGYYGYSSPSPRDGDDALSAFFAPMAALSINKDRGDALQKELDDLQRQKTKLESSIDNALKEVGGRDGNELGAGGELFALADKCFDITAGKYTYEVCVFGKAAQKEGKGGGGGTNLGKYTHMDMDDETGERVLYWKGGAKCWNGPARSATVHVTCGAETKIISADEPETCTYVFEMESHIACDDLYKNRMGLE